MSSSADCAAPADEVRVVYVSPLKALGADIPRTSRAAHIGQSPGGLTSDITAAVTAAIRRRRSARRRGRLRILVTTQSLPLLTERSRQMLRTVRTVIVDEIHAVIGTRRGAHLALSLERLARIAERPIQRLGLSATQKPIDEVARFLVGKDGGGCEIVDAGHARPMDLGVEVPASPLEAVMSREVWEEQYDRLTALISEHARRSYS